MAVTSQRYLANRPVSRGLLLAAFALIALWYLTKSCFLSGRLYACLYWLIPAMLGTLFLFWFALALRRSYKNNFVVPTNSGNVQSSVSRALGYAVLTGVIFGLLSLIIIAVGTMSLVYATSWTPSTFSSPLRKHPGGHNCSYYLTFYNPPIEREVTTCSSYWGTDPAVFLDDFVIEERVGPLGARLVAIRHPSS